MSDVAIRVAKLGKQYKIGPLQQPNTYKTLREVVREAVIRGAIRNLRGQRRDRSNDTIWALRDVSFEIMRGEVVGVIGRNGAGKSTLLRILSRITEPTEGYAETHGRVGSLLEVGTGFHPELTGRENIYLNGAILGMKKAEIERKFDEIVAFAEIEKFLDTPVKHYSSGMYVRLAFAVAAHLDPEILLVDEVLAVGDAAFQKKCLGKMGDVAKEGRTVLFVSHNMGAISTLTARSLWLDGGNLAADAHTGQAVAAYLASSYSRRATWKASRLHEKPIQILSVRVSSDSNPGSSSDFDVRSDIRIDVEYVVRRVTRNAVVAINIHAADGTHLLSLEDADQDPQLLLERPPAVYVATVTLPGGWLNSGSYLLRVGCGMAGRENYENIEALTFTLVETGDPTTRGHRAGYLLPMLKWQTRLVPAGASPVLDGARSSCQA